MDTAMSSLLAATLVAASALLLITRARILNQRQPAAGQRIYNEPHDARVRR